MRTPRSKFALAAGLILGSLGLAVVLSDGRAAKLYNLIPESGHSKRQRADAEWYKYRAEQCVFTGQTRKRVTYDGQFNPATKTYHSTPKTITEYEWKCRGGDVHWTR